MPLSTCAPYSANAILLLPPSRSVLAPLQPTRAPCIWPPSNSSLVLSVSHFVRSCLIESLHNDCISGGASATYSTHWLDTIKVRMQSFPSTYVSCSQCFRETLKQGGLAALYQGAVPAVTGHAIKASAVFMSYGLCQELVWKLSLAAGAATEADGARHDLAVWQLASAGAMTGVLASFVLCPVELVKCRMQALCVGDACYGVPKSAGSGSGMLKFTRGIIRRDGLRGLYRGLSGMWAKEIPGSFIYFGSYELAKSLATAQMNEGSHYSKTTVFTCGVFAGLCFCVTHPIESIKTRVQVTPDGGQQGFMRATYTILKQEGLKPLCSGLKPNMFRACIYSGVQFVTYEMVKDFLLQPQDLH
ncbi:hypothetical protein CAPTEDRAFT_170059 [Capitella teleta]|uniref:Uncharacterized protein n=1 Tax=Capitella teleta TaxID=283909 RepID=R7TYW2_CAPTE|nr:hypothetical protein CAPTEDRAFT_170059 [Capitella teleta]|eukprot:ELT98792.1 hypothetical protein CAPTEDRAFT_170059 [Capitella teleta]